VILLVVTAPLLRGVARQYRLLTPAERQAGQMHFAAFLFFATLGSLSFLLQFYNIGVLNLFWPFFVGIAVSLLAAMFQFMLMVLRSPDERNMK